VEHVDVGGLAIAYLDDGPRDGRPVVMLHGFPDGPWTFDHLAAAVAAAGYRVIRPSLRGYPPTGVPPGRTVALPDLVADVEDLAVALDLADPVLVGHDWGAVVGWTSASAPTAPWTAFIALAIPPNPVLARTRIDPVQALRRSGYMLWLQLPGVERLLPHLVERLYRAWSPGWDPPAAHLARVREVLSDRAAARAAIGYYRWIVPAFLTGRFPADARAVPTIPVRYLHGADDTCFPAAAARRAERHLPAGAVRVVPMCGHFLHLERPDEIAEDVLRTLQQV
jgi:pimeloyl-ACP methyl ester carboxylesterase